jgi:hypothetical protein
MSYGLTGNGPILLLRQPFLDQLKTVTLNTTIERKIKAIEPYTYSIDHKINVARYSAGLVKAIQPDDFGKHLNAASVNGSHSSQAEYVGRCIYYAHNWEQYALSLLFFIDTFAAAAFSLFDISGHLLKEIYNLSVDQASFFKVSKELELLSPNLYNKFLAHYILEEAVCEEWFTHLKKLRNHMTHAEVMDIVKLESPMPPHMQIILLKKEVIGSSTDIELKQFIENCFDGLEKYMEKFYEILAKQAIAENLLPITGRHDNLI